MASEKELEECRKVVQDIIDKHLPEDKRFSVENFSQEWLYYISSFLLEKDEEKKEHLWKEFWSEMENINRQEQTKLRKDYLEIVTKKQEYETIMKSFDGLKDIVDDIEVEQEFEQKFKEQ